MLALRTLLSLATLAIVAAETSVVSLFLLDAPESLVGSVVATNAETTTYSINCAPHAKDCESFGLMYTAAPTSVDWALAPPYDRHGTMLCSVGGTTTSTALCTLLLPSTGSTTKYGMTTTMSGRTLPSQPVTITAGPSVDASATATGASGTGDGDPGNSASQTGGASASGATSSSTGGLPQITADPRVVLGGAAAALVAAAL